MATRLHLFLSLLIFAAIQSFVSAASALTISTGYPQRTNTQRTAPVPGTFDLKAPNAGINRADCFDTTQKWQFSVGSVPAETTHVEIWARGDEKTCAPAAERSGATKDGTPHCYLVASLTPEAVADGKVFEIDNTAIIQAADKKTNVDGSKALETAEVCAKSGHMSPTPIYLHVMAFKASAVIGYDSSTEGESDPEEVVYKTLYDLMGPPPPSGLEIGTGEGMITASFKASVADDFAKYRVYCFRAVATPTPSDTGVTDSGGDGGGADAADAGSGDAGAKASSDAGDAGKSDAGEAPKCPAGYPFKPGALPTDALEAYVCGESKSQGADIVLEGRDNEVPYAVAIAAVDKQGNYGLLSEVECGTPKATNSFWDEYNAAGGHAGGGYCSIGDAGLSTSGYVALGAIALAASAWLTRRRRAAAVPLVLAALFCTKPSLAQEAPALTDSQAQPSIVTIEARFGPYRPQVDTAFEKGTPYKNAFGDAPRVMAGAQIDVVPIHIRHLGSIGFGGMFGYTYASAKADYADGSGASAEKTSFDLWLLSVLTTVRFDVVARETRIPLVPYAKAGLMWGLWNSTDGRGVSHSADGRAARGRTNGFVYAVGAMLLLDAFDPEAAKTFASERGVKHSYVFGELTIADLRGFGQTDVMRVGDKTWTAGVAFEM